MKNKEDKNIKKLVENMMKDAPLETPSFDFTSRVMSEAFLIEKKKSFSYKPVISKGGWFIILASIVGLITWLGFTQNKKAANANFPFINGDGLLKIFSGFQFSNTTVNILLLATMMMLIQIILLKSYLNKRFLK
jgi:hypothetical protein